MPREQLSPWNSVVSGTSAAILANVLVYPLDVGLGSSIAGTASMNFAYFYWSAAARSLYQGILRRPDLPYSAGLVNEFGLGATCKAHEEALSMWQTAAKIVQSDDGWTGLWRGLKVNLILVVNPMITYGFYQWLRARLTRVRRNIGPVEAFLLGALSKVLATVTTHPLIVAKTMLQSEPPRCQNGKPFRGFTEALGYIIRTEGVCRLYKGLLPQVTKGLLVFSIGLTPEICMLTNVKLGRTEILLIMALSAHRRGLLRRLAMKRGSAV
ncbi:mitochondrial carrier domain-containing protein [Aspergillus aurantiobrunneus]